MKKQIASRLGNIFFFSLFVVPQIKGFSVSLLNKQYADENFYVDQNIPHRSTQIKPWNILVYVAGDNDLNPFVWHNIKQLAQIGSNKYCNIIVQVNESDKRNHHSGILLKKAKRHYSTKEKRERLDSGSEKTVIDFCSSCLDEFPCEHLALIFWDHGTGYLDPNIRRAIYPASFFEFNPENLMLELNRNIEFLETLILEDGGRGICFDDSHKSYLTNQKIKKALSEVSKKFGKPIDILGLDACLMSMIEFASLVRPYCDIMVASEEVELGWGWNYATALSCIENNNPTPQEFATQIVKGYGQTYQSITPDFTLSAVNLKKSELVSKIINDIAVDLAKCLQLQLAGSVKSVLQNCRAKKNCLHFEEPSYVDLGDILRNIKKNIGYFKLSGNQTELLARLEREIAFAFTVIDDSIITKANGKKIPNASGLPIYFPEKSIHPSYETSDFAKENNWVNFIITYLMLP